MKRLNAYVLRPALIVAIAAGSATLASAASSVGSVSVGQAPSAAAASPAATSGKGAGDGYEPFSARNRKPPRIKRPIFCLGGNCRNQRSEASARVCFYTAANFRGAHFCTRPGTTSVRLSSRWNDRISSVRITGPATAKLCSASRLDGRCILISSDRSHLASLDDAVSSFVVR